MARPGARPGDWKTKAMREPAARLDVERTFDAGEAARLREGLLPEEMEDKWFIVFEDGALTFYRSWTGSCVYKVPIEETGADGARIRGAIVARDPESYAPALADGDRKLLLWLIDALLLGKDERHSP